MTIITIITLIAICAAIAAITSGFENGMLIIPRARLDHGLKEGRRKAILIHKLLRKPSNLLSTVLLSTNIAYVSCSLLEDRLFHKLGLAGGLQMAGAAFLFSVFLLIVAEIIPKSWFRQDPYTRSGYFIYPIMLFRIIFFPIIWILSAFSNLMAGLFYDKSDSQLPEDGYLVQDFNIMLKESYSQGIIDKNAFSILNGVLLLHRKTVADLMIPLSEVKAINTMMTIENAIEISKSKGFSRLPVYSSEKENQLIGVFSAYNVFFSLERKKWRNSLVKDFLHSLITLPEDATPEQAVEKMKKNKFPFITIINKKGKTTGIITLTDLLFFLKSK
ncbi:MAG: CNNM domain-containing protein [Verrucomicrobiota bacterium]|nr:CNNM domain-containing protein [Verrucomicrobiota bacterium]